MMTSVEAAQVVEILAAGWATPIMNEFTSELLMSALIDSDLTHAQAATAARSAMLTEKFRPNVAALREIVQHFDDGAALNAVNECYRHVVDGKSMQLEADATLSLESRGVWDRAIQRYGRDRIREGTTDQVLTWLAASARDVFELPPSDRPGLPGPTPPPELESGD